MTKEELLSMINSNPISINLSKLNDEKVTLIAKKQEMSAYINQELNAIKVDKPVDLDSDNSIKWLINYKIYNKQRVENKISQALLLQIAEESNNSIIKSIIEYRHIKDKLKKLETFQKSIVDEKVAPEFKIKANEKQSIYSINPSINFSIEELSNLLDCRAYYRENLSQVLKVVEDMKIKRVEIITVLNSTIYYKSDVEYVPAPIESVKERQTKIDEAVNGFNAVFKNLKKSEEIGSIKLDLENETVISDTINIELLKEQKYEYRLQADVDDVLKPIMQLSASGDYKLQSMDSYIVKDRINVYAYFSKKGTDNGYAVLMCSKNNNPFEYIIVKNPTKNDLKDFINFDEDMIFSNKNRIKKTLANYIGISALANKGDYTAWRICVDMSTVFVNVCNSQEYMIVSLFYPMGMSGKEVAEYLNISQEEVKTTIDTVIDKIVSNGLY